MLVVWADVRTAFEEDRVKSIEQVISSEFFKINLHANVTFYVSFQTKMKMECLGHLKQKKNIPKKLGVFPWCRQCL